VSGDRRTILDRGFQWLDAHVPYNQGQTHDSYRTDCSGFVSMAWQLGRSETTATLYNFSSVTFDQLQPGDALVMRSGGSGHAVLFTGWKDSSHSTACILHEAGSAYGTQFIAWTASNLRSTGYKPIRKAGVTGTATTPSTPSGSPSEALPVPPIPPGDPSTSSSAPGGTCNRNGAYYCGNPRSNLKGDPNSLYHCEKGQMVLVQACTNGCTTSAPGVDDLCAPDDGSSSTTSSDTGSSTGTDTSLGCVSPNQPCFGPGDACCNDDLGLPMSCLADPNDTSGQSYVCSAN
jgi:hypothetical protein